MKALLLIFCASSIGLAAASSGPSRSPFPSAMGGGPADAVLRDLDRLAARAAAAASQQGLERAAVAALREACAPRAVEAVVVQAGLVSGRCARSASLGVYRIVPAQEGQAMRHGRESRPTPSSAKPPGREAEDLGRPTHPSHQDGLVAGAADAPGGEPSPAGAP